MSETINDLADLSLKQIFEYLPKWRDRLSIGLVCRRWRLLILLLWQSVTAFDTNDIGNLLPAISDGIYDFHPLRYWFFLEERCSMLYRRCQTVKDILMARVDCQNIKKILIKDVYFWTEFLVRLLVHLCPNVEQLIVYNVAFFSYEYDFRRNNIFFFQCIEIAAAALANLRVFVWMSQKSGSISCHLMSSKGTLIAGNAIQRLTVLGASDTLLFFQCKQLMSASMSTLRVLHFGYPMKKLFDDWARRFDSSPLLFPSVEWLRLEAVDDAADDRMKAVLGMMPNLKHLLIEAGEVVAWDCTAKASYVSSRYCAVVGESRQIDGLESLYLEFDPEIGQEEVVRSLLNVVKWRRDLSLKTMHLIYFKLGDELHPVVPGSGNELDAKFERANVEFARREVISWPKIYELNQYM